MAHLTPEEEDQISALLGLASGQVIGRTERGFASLVAMHCGLDIRHARYGAAGTNSAERLRALWRTEPPAKVARLLAALIDDGEIGEVLPDDPALREAVVATVQRLRDEAAAADAGGETG